MLPKSCREAEERMEHHVLALWLSSVSRRCYCFSTSNHFPRAQDVDFRALVGARSSPTTMWRAGSSRADFRHAEVDVEVGGALVCKRQVA